MGPSLGVLASLVRGGRRCCWARCSAGGGPGAAGAPNQEASRRVASAPPAGTSTTVTAQHRRPGVWHRQAGGKSGACSHAATALRCLTAQLGCRGCHDDAALCENIP